MRALRLFLLALLLLTVQTTVQGVWGLTTAMPDLPLIFLVVVALRYGPAVGVWMGLLIGIFHDVYTVEAMGAGALAFVLVGYGVGFAEEQVLRLDFITKVILLALAFIAKDLLHGWASGLSWETIGELFVSQSIPQGLTTLLLGTFWFYFFNLPSRSI